MMHEANKNAAAAIAPLCEAGQCSAQSAYGPSEKAITDAGDEASATIVGT
jgi:hypothetical protein